MCRDAVGVNCFQLDYSYPKRSASTLLATVGTAETGDLTCTTTEETGWVSSGANSGTVGTTGTLCFSLFGGGCKKKKSDDDDEGSGLLWLWIVLGSVCCCIIIAIIIVLVISQQQSPHPAKNAQPQLVAVQPGQPGVVAQPAAAPVMMQQPPQAAPAPAAAPVDVEQPKADA